MRHHRARHRQCSENGKTVSASCCSTGGNECRARKAVVEGKRRCTDCGRRSCGRCTESGCCCQTQMKTRSTIVFLALVVTLSGEELPRKVKTPRESCPSADVIYDSVTTLDGKRLRTILTKPRNAKGKVPVIFVAGWLSCDSVEAPAGTKDESGLVFRGLAQLPEFALFRMDKQGVATAQAFARKQISNQSLPVTVRPFAH